MIKMKNFVSSLFFLLLISNLSAQTIDSVTQKHIESFVKSNIYVQPEEVDIVATGKVFSGTFFKTKVTTSFTPTESQSYIESGINVHKDSVTRIESCCSNQDLPILMSLIKKDFLLKDEKSAKLFEAALDILYPVKKKEIPNVKHLHEGLQWIFIRGSFFENFQAFIVTTDTDGTVTKIEYKLPYPEN